MAGPLWLGPLQYLPLEAKLVLASAAGSSKVKASQMEGTFGGTGGGGGFTFGVVGAISNFGIGGK